MVFIVGGASLVAEYSDSDSGIAGVRWRRDDGGDIIASAADRKGDEVVGFAIWCVCDGV